MGKPIEQSKTPQTPLPTFETDETGGVNVAYDDPATLPHLFGTETLVAAEGLMISALNALGRSGEEYRPMIAAMHLELQPRDAAEAMLITQMTATHVAMTSFAQKMMDTTAYGIRESVERSVSRLRRTYLAQMEALKKYPA